MDEPIVSEDAADVSGPGLSSQRSRMLPAMTTYQQLHAHVEGDLAALNGSVRKRDLCIDRSPYGSPKPAVLLRLGGRRPGSRRNSNDQENGEGLSTRFDDPPPFTVFQQLPPQSHTSKYTQLQEDPTTHRTASAQRKASREGAVDCVDDVRCSSNAMEAIDRSQCPLPDKKTASDAKSCEQQSSGGDDSSSDAGDGDTNEDDSDSKLSQSTGHNAYSRSASPRKGEGGYEFASSLDVQPVFRSAHRAFGSPTNVVSIEGGTVHPSFRRSNLGRGQARVRRVRVKAVLGAEPITLGVDPSRFRFRSIAVPTSALIAAEHPPDQHFASTFDIASPEMPPNLFAKERLKARRCSCAARPGAQKPCPVCLGATTSDAAAGSRLNGDRNKFGKGGVANPESIPGHVRVVENIRKMVACTLM